MVEDGILVEEPVEKEIPETSGAGGVAQTPVHSMEIFLVDLLAEELFPRKISDHKDFAEEIYCRTPKRPHLVVDLFVGRNGKVGDLAVEDGTVNHNTSRDVFKHVNEDDNERIAFDQLDK